MAENARPPAHWQLASAEFFGSLSAEANVLWGMANIKKAAADNPAQASSLEAAFSKLTPVIEGTRADARETAAVLGLKTCASTVAGTSAITPDPIPATAPPPPAATDPTPPAAPPADSGSGPTQAPSAPASAGPARAASARAGETITSPSGFNHCHWYESIPSSASNDPGVVCTSTTGPTNGYVVMLTASGRRWAGYGSKRWLFAAGARLAYGKSRSLYGIVCSSRTSGLRCVQRSSPRPSHPTRVRAVVGLGFVTVS